MLMLIIAVVIGVLIALVIYNNPEIIVDLIKLVFYGAIGIGAIFLVVMLFASIFDGKSNSPSKMIPVNVKTGVSISEESINSALAQYEPINKNCPQTPINKHLGITFEFNYKKYLIVQSSCVPDGGNQNFDYINLIEVDPIGKLSEKDSIKFQGNPSSIQVENGLITIRYLGYGEKDPKCCPSVSTLDKYELVDNKLIRR